MAMHGEFPKIFQSTMENKAMKNTRNRTGDAGKPTRDSILISLEVPRKLLEEFDLLTINNPEVNRSPWDFPDGAISRTRLIQRIMAKHVQERKDMEAGKNEH